VTTVTGMVIAAISILVANRLLPADLPQRGEWEETLFWGAWLVALAHALWRTAPVAQARIAPAWREQSLAIVALAVVAVLANWATTGDHLLKTLGTGYWPVAGLDLSLLVTAGLAWLAAGRLRRREDNQASGAPAGRPGTEARSSPLADAGVGSPVVSRRVGDA
jgi:hypothetical protein